MTDPDREDRPLALVTGASGFVGGTLVSQLLDARWRVRALVHRTRPDPREAVEQVSVDVRDYDGLVPAMAGVRVVFHLAAKITLARRDPEAWDVNVHGPAAVARACLDAGVERLVHCSSVHAFDRARSRPVLDERSARSIRPERPLYDRSKAAGEAELRAVIARGLDATIVNPTGIIGPLDRGPSRINAIIERAARGRLPVVVTGGFDWVDVRDVAAGLVAAASHGRTGENYLLGGHRASTLELVRLAASFTGRRGPLVAVPVSVARRVAPVGALIGRAWHSEVFTPASIGALWDDPIVDWSKAAAELGYRPRPLEDSVRDTVEWFGSRVRR
jgi:dihydroflavonol-4-reductase